MIDLTLIWYGKSHIFNTMKRIYCILLVWVCTMGILQAQTLHQAPQPPTNQKSYFNEHQNGLHLPTAREAGQKVLTGIVQFVVETDGSLSGIEFTESIGYGIDEQIIEFLKNTKDWKPAVVDGQPIRV